MTMQSLLMGWTADQWDQAETYYNLCHRDSPLRLVSFYRVACDLLVSQACRTFDAPNLDNYIEVQDWWNRQRGDQPGDVRILIAEYYRTRSK